MVYIWQEATGRRWLPTQPFTENKVLAISTATISSELTEMPISLISLSWAVNIFLWKYHAITVLQTKPFLQFPFMGYEQPNYKERLTGDSGAWLHVNSTFPRFLEHRKNYPPAATFPTTCFKSLPFSSSGSSVWCLNKPLRTAVRNKHFSLHFSDKETEIRII